MANNIRLQAALDDKVSGPLDRIRGKIDTLGKSGAGKGILGGLAAGATLGAIGLVTGAVGALTDKLGEAQTAYREDEASQSRLRASLAANVPSYDGNTDAIEKVLAERMKLGFSDDAQRASLAQLVTRTKDSTKALDLQRTAMDLARLKGIDLESATNLIGRAYSGNVGALARAGIAVDKNATATEALAAVQKAATGQAAAFANTSEGRVAASQLKVGESMERVGMVVAKVSDFVLPILAEAFEQVVDVLGDVVAAIQKFLSENRIIVDYVTFVGGILVNVLGAALGIVGTAVGDMAKLVGIAFTAVVTIVQAVVGTVIGYVRNLMGIVAEIPGPWQEGAKAIKATLTEMQGNVESWGTNTSTLAGKTADDIVANTATGLAGGAQAVGDAAEEGLGDPLTDAVQTGRDAAVTIARKTPQDIADALRDKRTAWQKAVDQLKDDLENKMSTAAEIAKVKAELAGTNLAKGLKSKDPVVQAQAKATKKILTDRLTDLANDGTGYGWQLGMNYAAGIKNTTSAVAKAAAAIARQAFLNLRLASPAKEGPLSQDGGPEGWGEKLGMLYGKGLRAKMPDVGSMLGAVPALAGGSTLMAAGPFGRAATASGPGDTLHVHIHTLATPTAAQREELEQVLTPIVVNGLQRRRLLTRAGTF